ncbi:MAG: universal stress protein [Deltaproteobacteria bacterium]|nr:MAG: universal stress protein [Deltaproteobacteria bacterium]
MAEGTRTVLVATDFSGGALAAVREAAAFARAWSATLAVLHVNDDLSDDPGFSVSWLRPFGMALDALELGRIAHEVAHEKLETLVAAEDLADVDVTLHVTAGSAVQEIARLARELEADVVVAGRSGAGALERLMLGGTSERLIARLPCPLVLVGETPLPAKGVLLPVDFGPCAPKQLAFLRELPRVEEADTHVLSVYALPSYFWDAIEGHLSEEQVDRTVGEAMRQRLDDLVVEREESEHHVFREVRQGIPAREILSFARARKVDTIILGSAGHGGVTTTLPGSTVLRVSRDFRGRVVITPPEESTAGGW